MEVFILLVLSIGLCQAKAVHDELGKDDPEVVNAVATAIKVLNEDRSHGNKFALRVILHAYRIAGPGKKFLIIYQVRETACPIAADDPWQKCDLLRTSKGHSGNCTAVIDINESQQFTSIEQNCKIRPVMKKGEEQLVNGINYYFEYLIKETNCSKNEFPDLSPECKSLPGGLNGFCKAKAYVDNRNEPIHAQVECRLKAEDNKRTLAQECPGCHSPIAADSQELKKPLEAVVKLFNLKSSSDFYFKIVEITKISGKMLVGHVYRIDFKTQRTNCSKTEAEKPDENCTAVKGGELMSCHALVYVRPWEPSVKPEVTCTGEQALQTTELGESKDSEFQVTFYDDDDTINDHQNF